MKMDLLNTFNRLCKYLEKHDCSHGFLIERDNIIFKRNIKVFPNDICYSYNWFNSIIIPDIQTQLNYFLLPPLNATFSSSIFMDVHYFSNELPNDLVSLISRFGIPKSLEEINMKLDLYGA